MSTHPPSFILRGLIRILHSVAFRLRYQSETLQRRLIKIQFKQIGLPTGIPTWTTDSELEELYRLATQCPEGGNIVEIGSYVGASTCYLAAGGIGRGVNIICVDTWLNDDLSDPPRDTFAEFQHNTEEISGMITAVRKRSNELLPSDIRLPVHLAFIDADHSYDATITDVEFILPHMAADGVVVFHDTTTFAGVGRALAEVLEAGEWRLAGHTGNLTWIRRAHWSPWPPSNAEASAGSAAPPTV